MKTTFESLDLEERGKIVTERKNVTLIVKKNTFQVLPNQNEVSPPPILLTEEFINQVFIQTPNGEKGNWMKFFIMVYYYKGRILYKEIDKDTLEVDIQFQK